MFCLHALIQRVRGLIQLIRPWCARKAAQKRGVFQPEPPAQGAKGWETRVFAPLFDAPQVLLTQSKKDTLPKCI